MNEKNMFKVGDRVKTTDGYSKRFGKESKGIIIDIIDVSCQGYPSICPSFCAEISVKNELNYINFDWLKLVE